MEHCDDPSILHRLRLLATPSQAAAIMARYFLPSSQKRVALDQPTHDALAFHRRLPGYTPTPLLLLDQLAKDLGIRRLFAKDETARFGLPAFKILGASWATYRALVKRLGTKEPTWSTIHELKEELSRLPSLSLVAASEGNHGRAVAHIARLFGLDATIFVPSTMSEARQDAIASEGAEIVVVDGTYDTAVLRAADYAAARQDRLLISDTAHGGYTEIPQDVVRGYSTMFWECDHSLERLREGPPDIVLVQIGVGSLAAAAANHYRQNGGTTRLVGVEPDSAASTLDSAISGTRMELPGPFPSILAGLNCGAPSSTAWPIVSQSFDAFLGIEDSSAQKAQEALAVNGVRASATGAAGLAGLVEILSNPYFERVRESLRIDSRTSALVLITEGQHDELLLAWNSPSVLIESPEL